jgi:hypothetical protein
VAILYHRKARTLAQPTEPTTQLAAIEAFLRNCRRPALLEYGEPAVSLAPGAYALEIRTGKLFIEAWAETRSLSRRILTIERQSPGILDCTVQRFGGTPGKLSFLDLDRPQTAHKAHCGERQNFAEQFRRMLCRQFPGWSLSVLSCGMDLQRSFSSVFPRAALTRGNQQIAALACPSAADEPALFTFALIWHDYLDAHSRPGTQTSLALFLPERSGNLTAHRLRWLTGRPLNAHLFRYNLHGSAGEVDPADLGNLQTRICAPALRSDRMNRPRAVRHSDASERALEACVRSNLSSIEASLVPGLVHSQVITFAAGDRDLVDLLAISTSSRLAVLELKASEDIHLPLQALDYWMRIRWHAERGELRHLFPAIPVSNLAPRLLLVAPAMAFHSTNATILRYFSPEIEVERVGLNLDWPRNLKIVMRLNGSDAPISHGSLE